MNQWKRVSHSVWKRGEFTVRKQTVDSGPAGFQIMFVCRRGAAEIGAKFYLREAQQLAEQQP